VGVRWLGSDHPFVNVGATDNIFELRTESYDRTPLIIRGPGAGARITAVQVLSDILTLS
jgi:aspartokinase/homoserine dehydrogenase 1